VFLIVMAAGKVVVQGEPLADDTCVVELQLPEGATVSADGNDYGTKRKLTFRKLAPGVIYRSKMQIGFPSGVQEGRLVLIEGGRQLRLAMVDPAVARPELVLQTTLRWGGVAWSRDGKHILAGRVLAEAETCKHLRVFRYPVATPTVVAFSPDGSRVALGASGGWSPTEDSDKVYLYDAASGRLLHTLVGVYGKSVAFSADGERLAVGGTRMQEDARTGEFVFAGQVDLWDVRTGRLLRTFKSEQSISTVCFSPDGRYLLSGADDYRFNSTGSRHAAEMILWETASGRRVRSFAATEAGVNQVAISPDNRRVATASSERSVRIWDLATGKMQHALLGDLDTVTFVAFLDGEKTVVTASNAVGHERRSRFSFWEVPSGNYLRSVDVSDQFASAAITPDGKRILIGGGYYDIESGESTGHLLLIDAATGRRIISKSFTDEVDSVAISPNGKTAYYSLEYGNGVALLDLETGRRLHSFYEYGDFGEFSPDGKSIVVEDDGGALLWDIAAAKPLRKFPEEAREFSCGVFSCDGKKLLLGTEGTRDNPSRIIEFDIESGGKQRVINAFKSRVGAVGYAGQSGSFFATSYNSDEDALKIWKANNDEPARTLSIDDGNPRSAAVDPNGSLMVEGATEMSRIWDVKSGRRLGVLATHHGWVHHVAFSADGQKIISAGNYNRRIDDQSKEFSDVIEWDAATGRQLRHVEVVGDQAYVFAFSPDHKQFVTREFEGAVIDAVTGETLRRTGQEANEMSSFAMHEGHLRCQVQRPDGHAWIDVTAGTVVSELAGTQKRPHQENYKDTDALAVSPDGRFAISPVDDANLQVWDISTGQRLQKLTGHRWEVSNAVFSRDGRHLATSAQHSDYTANRDDGEVLVWDFNDGILIQQFQFNATYRIGMSFSPDNRLIAVAKRTLIRSPDDDHNENKIQGAAYVWNVRTGSKVRSYSHTHVGGKTIAFSPDGKFLYTDAPYLPNKQTSLAIVWDAATGRRIRTLKHSSIDATANSILFSSDGALAAILPDTASDRAQATIWDASTGRLLWSLGGEEKAFYRAYFLPSSRYLIAGDYLWDVMTGQRLARFVVSGAQGELVTLTPDGLFDGSRSARERITFRVGGDLNVVPVERFFQDFYRPGLLAELLNGGRPMPTASVGHKLAPAVRILSPTGGVVSTPRVTCEVEVTDRGGGVKGPWLKHNGARLIVPGKPQQSGNLIRRTFEVALVEGENKVEVWAATADGSWESEPARLILEQTQATDDIQLHVVAVGINQYAETGMNLRFAAADARAIAKLFRDRGPSLYGDKRTHITQLLDEQATKEGIANALAEVAKRARTQDAFTLFLAGHGAMVDQRYFFIPHEFKSSAEVLDDDIRSQGLAGDELDDLVSQIPALKRIVVYDTCQSGGVISTSRTARNPFAFRKAVEAMNRSQGSFIIAATAATDEAQEVTELGHGVLTYTLLAALGAVDRGPLKRRRARFDEEDEVIGVRDWFGYAQDEVPSLTRTYFGEEQFVRFIGSGASFPVLPVQP